MKKILVTGSDGFLASRFVDYYKNVFDITALNRQALDITNEEAVLNHFQTHQYDIVFHCAAISDTGFCEQHPELAHQVNTLATSFIAKGCALQNTTLVFASSDQIFNGNPEDGPYTESTVPVPQTVYAHSKLNAENHIKTILPTYYNLRLPWMFCLHERFKKTNTNILTNIQKALLTASPISLATNEYRSMTYVYDVIEQFQYLLDLPYGDYNFGSENIEDGTYTIGTFVLNAMHLNHRISDTLIEDTERFKDQKRDLRISNQKLARYNVNFPTTKEGITKCLQDFRAFN